MHIVLFASLLTIGLCQIGGGWSNQDPTKPEYQNLLNEVVTQQLAAVPNGYTLTAVKSQVVAGMNYEFTLQNTNGMTCVIRVFDQSWTKTREVTQDTCKPLITTRNARAGGYQGQNPADQKWADLLNKLETTYNLLDTNQYNNVQIVDVQTQVVAGINYKYTLNVDGKTCTLVYFEQVWTNTHEIKTDTCGLSSKKRAVGLPGGYSPQDPTDQKWTDLLNKLETTYNLTDMNQYNNVQVVDVQTQVVAGMNYKYTLNVDGKTCTLVYFEQVWTNTHEIKTDTCGLSSKKRAAGIPGGYFPQDPTDQKWADLLKKLDTDGLLDLSGNNIVQIVSVGTQGTDPFLWLQYRRKHDLLIMEVNVQSAEWSTGLNVDQVVSGINTFFVLDVDGQTCELLYYSQPWTNTKEISKDTCNLKATSKRQLGGGLAGGWTPQNPADQQWDDKLQALDAKYNLIQLNGVNGYKIVGVSTQVVAGTNYKFTLEVNNKTCVIVYFEQYWTDTRKITEDTCHIKVTHNKRQMVVGGYMTENAADPKWMDILTKYENNNVINLGGANDLRILKVQQQVVAGFNYKYTLFMNGRVCELTLFDQSWTNTLQVLHTSCAGVKVTRSLLNTQTGTQKCMGAILDRVNAMSNSMFRLVDHHTTQTQVSSNGAEMNYHVMVVLTASDCMNSGSTAGYTSVECPPKQGSPIHNTWTADCRYDNTGAPAQVSNLNMVSN